MVQRIFIKMCKIYIFKNLKKQDLNITKSKLEKYISDDLYKNGIFDDNDNEIANNVRRKVKTVDEINQYKVRKKNNDTRF